MQILDVNGDRYRALAWVQKLSDTHHHLPTFVATIADVAGGEPQFEHGYPYWIGSLPCWLQIEDGSNCYFHARIGDIALVPHDKVMRVDFVIVEGPWRRFQSAKTTRVVYRKCSGELVPR